MDDRRWRTLKQQAESDTSERAFFRSFAQDRSHHSTKRHCCTSQMHKLVEVRDEQRDAFKIASLCQERHFLIGVMGCIYAATH